MKKLFLKLIRDIKESKGQFIAITLIIAIGSAFFTGLSSMQRMLDNSITEYYTENNLADLWLYYANVPGDETNTLEEIDNINTAESRYTYDGTQNYDSLETTLRIHSIPKNNKINKPLVIKGNMPTESNEILIDERYANSHNLNPGDETTITLNSKKIKVNITGLCESVEYVFKVKDSSDSLPDHNKFGIVYTTESTFIENFNTLPKNEILIDAKDNCNIAQLSSDIDKKAASNNFLYQINKERNISYQTYSNEVEQWKSLSAVFPIIFFIVAAAITFITISRIVDSQRNQIGIMKALGIKESSILSHYLQYALFIGLIGSIIGSILGSILIPKFFVNIFKEFYVLPYNIKLYPIFILPSILLSIIFGVVAAYLACRKTLKENPATAMRPKISNKSKKILVERFKPLWKKLSYGNKIILRNIFLGKKRALFTSLGIIGGLLLLVCGFGMNSSINYLMDLQFDKLYTYDIRVDYEKPITNINSLELPKDIEYLDIGEIAVEVGESNDKQDTKLTVMKNTDYIKIYDEDKDEFVDLNDNGVVISKKLAEKYNLSLGDTLKLKIINPEYKGKSFEVKVANLSSQYIGQDIYCTPKYLDSLNIQQFPYTILIKTNNIASTSDYFKNLKEVKKVTPKYSSRDSIKESMETMNSIVILCVVGAIVLSSTVIYNISSINIHERKRELATLKVLGYHNTKINKLIFVENIIITIFGIIVGLPLGFKFFEFIIKSAETDAMTYPSKLNLSSIIICILLTLIFTLVSNFMLRGKVKKIDMIESLKSVE